MKIHDEIDNYLAADLHSDLSDKEQNALHTHLVECADCRKLHQETKVMSKALEEKFADEKLDAAFEQRMLAGFRTRIPQRTGGIAKFIVDLMHLRAIRIAAAAVIVLILVGTGRWLTSGPAILGNEEIALPREGSFDDFRTKLAGFDTDKMRADVERARARNTMHPAPPTAAAESDVITDITRLGVRGFTDGLRLPASTGASETAAKLAQAETLAKEKAESSPNSESMVAAAAPAQPETSSTAAAVLGNRKLIQNASVELEIVGFDAAVQKITAFANEDRGYVATTSSEKQANGKLRGEIVVKVLPENLDHFLKKIRTLGELKNQTFGSEDITKAYFDTDARLKNARVMEQRLIEMLKTKTGKVADLLQVEKELGRVREEIEKMQGELKYWDSQVQFATVTVSLAEKDMEEPAAFLIKERAQLALYAPDVEKIYNDIKGLTSPKVQITNAQLDRDYSGRVSARVSMLIAPEESDSVIARVKGFGRVENFQVQTERIAQGGSGMSENAKTKREKVELNVTISREEQEQAFQQTSLRIRTSSVDKKAKELRNLTEKQSGRVRSSTFSRDPDGREVADVSLRVPMKNYSALMQSLHSLGKVEDLSVQRQDRDGAEIDEASAPADISIQVYSQGNIVSSQTGLVATLRRTLAQSVAAVMWSLRMIGVAVAFLAPWAIAIVFIVWIAKRVIF